MNCEIRQSGWMLAILVVSLQGGCSEDHEDKQAKVTESPADESPADEPRADESATDTHYDLEELKADFEQLVAGLDENPKAFTNTEAYNEVIDEQEALLGDNMSAKEFYNLLTPVVAAIKCGHTSLSMPDQSDTLSNLVPLDIKFVNDKAFIIADYSGSGIEAGSELVSINGNDIEDVTAEMLRRITADGDNLSNKYYKLNNWFGYLYPDLIDEANAYAIEVKPEGTSEVVSYNLEPATISTNQQQEEDVPIPTGNFSENYATLTVGSFNFYDEVTQTRFKERVDAFFATLKENETENLILDLRNNWGGEPTVAAHLLAHLLTEPVAYFSSEDGGGLYYDALTNPLDVADNAFHGHLYTLINGASFSSTGHIASLLDYHNIGTFIGQETGGGYLCTDDSSSLVLEHTGLVLYSSRRIFRTAVEGMTLGRGISPDYETTPTVVDYINGVDLEMDKALELMSEG